MKRGIHFKDKLIKTKKERKLKIMIIFNILLCVKN